MNIREKILKVIVSHIESIFAEKIEDLNGIKLTLPPNPEMGDFAFECFPLAKVLKQSPQQIADKLASEIEDDLFAEVTAVGPYLNLKLNSEIYAQEVLENINFSGGKKQEKVVIEYLSPNTNKPLHLGHVRNGCLGMSISKIQKYEGRDVSKIILINDRGIHICKSMLAWQKFGGGETPESTGMKGDHFVGKYYILFAIESEKDPSLNDEAQAMLKKWEAGDKEVVELWEKMNQWVYDGFTQTYENFVFEFDKYYYESETYKLGKDIILQGLESGVFKKGEGESVYFELPEEEFGLDENKEKKKVILIRKDGTTVYITQDIGTAISRFKDYKFDKMIYVVGSEQRYHFQCLVAILKALVYEWAENIFHFSYGMVYLPEGKMKSREGKVVDADNFYEEMFNLAREAVLEKHSELDKEEVEKRARMIALGAMKFYILRVGAEQDINFDPNESISFTGFTGPYCQYAYARIAGILRKAEAENIKYETCDYSFLGNPEERLLLQKIVLLNDKVADSAESLSPSTLAVHIYETAKTFNQFYHKHQIIGIESESLIKARLKLISQVAVVLKEGLDLLGIEVLDNM